MKFNKTYLWVAVMVVVITAILAVMIGAGDKVESCEHGCDGPSYMEAKSISDMYCGDGVCDLEEKATGNCSFDCNPFDNVKDKKESYCGDGVCDLAEKAENNCEIDCQ